MENLHQYNLKKVSAGPYQLYVASLCKRYPNLRLLSNFLNSTHKPDACRIRCLDFFESGLVVEHGELNSRNLSRFLQQPEDSRLQGHVLIVEDLTKDIIEILGSNLDIDPAFFAYHLYQARSEVERLSPLPSLLPSVFEKKSFISFKYIQAFSFRGHSALPHCRMTCNSNVRRNVTLSQTTGCASDDGYVGTVNRYINMLKTTKKSSTWLCKRLSSYKPTDIG